MNSDEVVPHVVNGDGRHVLLDLPRERIGEPRKSEHLHSHRQVLALHKTGGDVFRVRVADLRFLLAAYALWWGVAFVSVVRRIVARQLHQAA
jgi:hypothetical protein